MFSDLILSPNLPCLFMEFYQPGEKSKICQIHLNMSVMKLFMLADDIFAHNDPQDAVQTCFLLCSFRGLAVNKVNGDLGMRRRDSQWPDCGR